MSAGRGRYPCGPTHLNIKNLCALIAQLEDEVSLAQALDRYGLRYDGTPHRGVDDAWTIAGLVLQLSQRGAHIPFGGGSA